MPSEAPPPDDLHRLPFPFYAETWYLVGRWPAKHYPTLCALHSRIFERFVDVQARRPARHRANRPSAREIFAALRFSTRPGRFALGQGAGHDRQTAVSDHRAGRPPRSADRHGFLERRSGPLGRGDELHAGMGVVRARFVGFSQGCEGDRGEHVACPERIALLRARDARANEERKPGAVVGAGILDWFIELLPTLPECRGQDNAVRLLGALDDGRAKAVLRRVARREPPNHLAWAASVFLVDKGCAEDDDSARELFRRQPAMPESHAEAWMWLRDWAEIERKWQSARSDAISFNGPDASRLNEAQRRIISRVASMAAPVSSSAMCPTPDNSR